MTHELLIEKRKLIVFATIKCANDSSSFKFIIDTGATKTLIDERVATTLGYQLFRLDKGDRLMTAGGAIHAKILKLPNFSLFGKEFVNLEVNVIKFPLQYTVLADGLIGMDILLKFRNIKFDFDAKTAEI